MICVCPWHRGPGCARVHRSQWQTQEVSGKTKKSVAKNARCPCYSVLRFGSARPQSSEALDPPPSFPRNRRSQWQNEEVSGKMIPCMYIYVCRVQRWHGDRERDGTRSPRISEVSGKTQKSVAKRRSQSRNETDRMKPKAGCAACARFAHVNMYVAGIKRMTLKLALSSGTRTHHFTYRAQRVESTELRFAPKP